MMTAQSIGSSAATSYAEYLDARTAPEPRGDYYLGRDGEPTEAAGRWLASPTRLRKLGIVADGPVERGDLVALMEGRAPGSTRDDKRFLRPAGADGTRAAGIDVTFSAPKSVSIAWALAEGAQRAELAAAHACAVERAVQYLRASVPTTVSWDSHTRTNQPALARDLLAAEFQHTTARGVGVGVPDPQLHSHVVVTSVVRDDGRVAAVRSRPILRAAREVGAYSRAELAHELSACGYAIEAGTGRRSRYFELSGVEERVRDAFSRRSRQVAIAAERFRASHGRAPERGELRALKLHSREAKAPDTRPELEREWRATAAEHGLDHAPQPGSDAQRREERQPFADRVERALTIERATFSERELRATALEQSPGQLGPDAALARASEMIDDSRLLALANGHFTTREMRARELEITDRLVEMADDRCAALGEQVRDNAIAAVEERLGAKLSDEQRDAAARLTGPGRAAVLIGPAGTGKGVVLDAVARSERDSGRDVVGVALAGATAERLGDSAPTLAGRTATVDALLARGVPTATIIVDEAGMLDTRRLAALSASVDRAGGRLILVGDGAQLPAIDAGGMLRELQGQLPTATLSENRRAIDPRDAEAWDALRHGDGARAMAYYSARGGLHLTDTRDAALEAAVRRWDTLRAEVEPSQIALMSDGTSHEIERLNARAQHLRLEQRELGDRAVAIPAGDLPDAPYGLRVGDRVTWRASQRVPGERRIENGTRGVVAEADAESSAIRVRLDATGREVDVSGDDVANLRLAYAQHVYRQQGATVEHAIAVTGDWQTSRESTYVEASRARRGIDWYVARDELGPQDTDADRIDRLAAAMTRSVAKTPSLAEPLADPAHELCGRPTGPDVASLVPVPDLDGGAAVEVAPGID